MWKGWEGVLRIYRKVQKNKEKQKRKKKKRKRKGKERRKKKCNMVKEQ